MLVTEVSYHHSLLIIGLRGRVELKHNDRKWNNISLQYLLVSCKERTLGWSYRVHSVVFAFHDSDSSTKMCDSTCLLSAITALFLASLGRDIQPNRSAPPPITTPHPPSLKYSLLISITKHVRRSLYLFEMALFLSCLVAFHNIFT